jgi:hypothetical protein
MMGEKPVSAWQKPSLAINERAAAKERREHIECRRKTRFSPKLFPLRPLRSLAAIPQFRFLFVVCPD